MERKEGPIKCTWHLTHGEETEKLLKQSPHEHKPIKAQTLPPIYDSVLEHVGNTPMVRIHKIGKEDGLECELLAKCEFFNAGGSVKDRIGYRMVVDAEKSGRIKPGDTLIEPTSGNTGIGLALAAAVKGYKMIITLPEKMSKEKVDVLKALGATIIRTPTEAAFDSPESHIGVAKRLNKEIPNSHILDQYGNPSNPLAHYDGTAEEIYRQTEGKLDMIVITAGTGGTLTGIARKLKEKIPHLKVVAVDPEGSILALPETLNGAITSYKVEGIGYDFIPIVLDRSSELVDLWVKTRDKESFTMSRRLIKSEGLLCGGSSGSAMWAAVQAAKTLKAGQRCLVILPDSVRNYMSKFLSDDWMIDNQFLDVQEPNVQKPWTEAVVRDLSLPDAVSVNVSTTCAQAVEILKKGGFDQVPVVDDKKRMLGLVTIGNLLSKIASKRVNPNDSVSGAMFHFNMKRQFKEFTMETPLKDLEKFFETDSAAFITVKDAEGNSIVKKVVTNVDLLSYIMKTQKI